MTAIISWMKGTGDDVKYLGGGKALVEGWDSLASISYQVGVTMDDLCSMNFVDRAKSDVWLVRMYRHRIPIIVPIPQQEKNDEHIMDVVTSIDFGGDDDEQA